MLADLSFSEQEKNFFKIYLDLLKKYHTDPQKFKFFLEIKAAEGGIENLEKTVEKFEEFLRRYLFFKSKRTELEQLLPVEPDVVSVLKKYPYFVPYEIWRTYPSESSYEGVKWREPLLLAGGKDGKVRIWRFEGGKFKFLKEVGKESQTFPKFEVSEDHLFYAAGETLTVYYLPSGKVVAEIELGSPPEALNLEKGKVYVYKKVGNLAIKQQVWVEDGKTVFGPADPVAPTQVESGELDMVAVERKLVKVKDGKILLFEGVKRSEKVEFVSVDKFNFGHPVNDLLLIKNTVLVAPSGHPPAALDLQSGRITAKLEIPLNHSYRIRKNPKKDRIAVSHDQNLVSVWDLNTLQPVRLLESYFIDVLALDYSPDGRYLAASGEGRDINVWNTETWEMVKDIDLPVEGIMSLRFSPDGNHLVAGTAEGNIYFVNTSDWSVERTLSYHEDMVSDLVFTPDGKHLISASWDGKALLWNAESGEVEKILQSAEGRVWKLALSEDGRFLAVADWDGKVGIFDTRNWEEVATFIDKSGVTAVAFGGEHLVIGRKDGTIEVVHLKAAEEVSQEVVELSTNPAEEAAGVVRFDGNLLVYTKGKSLKVWDKEGKKVFSAKVEGDLKEVENLREPNLPIEVLPETFILQSDGYLYGAKRWEDYVQVLKGLEVVEDKGDFLREVSKPELLNEV